jgi:glycosyltransferase involved in cell wall biosynthesis
MSEENPAIDPPKADNDLNFSRKRSRQTTQTKQTKLCLSMIVKNESKIITRLLESVLPIIDTYCICDTGSTDNTIEVIEQFMAEKGVPGAVLQEPFRNFGYNRTFALDAAAAWGDYALLLDADMILIIDGDLGPLEANGYHVKQVAGSMEYYNMRIIKTGIGSSCIGPTHEYYNVPGRVDKLDTLWIRDIGDGGAKADKFERDIRLLQEGLVEEPQNARYHFYLANSYRDLGRLREAIDWYKKRVDLGGWVEEVFYTCYELGNCYSRLGEKEKAIYWWLDAWQRRPCRAESLYEVVKQYREDGKHTLAQMMLDKAKTIGFPANDTLFIKRQVYDFDLDFEQSVLSFYSGREVDHRRYLDLIGSGLQKHILLGNYKFYAKKLTTFGGTDYDFTDTKSLVVRGLDDTFHSSSPCIIPWRGGYLLNVRYVNYFIRADGGYDFKHNDGKIISLNCAYVLDKKLNILGTRLFDPQESASLRYLGTEDVKIFEHDGAVLFMGTVEHPYTKFITMGKGTYDHTQSRLLATAADSPNGRDCEKNWCYCSDASGNLRIVYEWYPLTVYDESMRTVVKESTDLPSFFQDVRGSSNGVSVGDEIWFLCHMVDYSVPRHYYHLFVVLDRSTLSYKRNSILFKFHGDCIEYALGLVVEPERILISYSRMDRSSSVYVIKRSVVEKELFST